MGIIAHIEIIFYYVQVREMQTLNKALDLLELFLKQDEIGIARLAELSNSNISTAHRFTSTLVKRGYLGQEHKRGKYSLGLKLLELSNVLENKLTIRTIALPFLGKLNKAVGETINLAVLDSNEVVFIEHIESSQNLRTTSKVGSRLPLYNTAVGKVLLAGMTDEGVEGFLNSKCLTKYTENTITDSNRLKREIQIARREGVALDNAECLVGVRCIGSPIKDSTGKVVAAVSVSGPSVRLSNERVEEIKLLVESHGLEISHAMGYRGK